MMSLDYERGIARTPSYLDPTIENSPGLYSTETLDYPSLLSDHAASPFSGSMSLPTDSPNFGFIDNNNYGYSHTSFTDSINRSYSPNQQTDVIAPPMLSYQLSAPGDASSGDDAQGSSGRGSVRPIPYAATVPRSLRYNPMAMPATRTSARAAVARGRRGSKSSTDKDTSDGEEEEEEEYKPTGRGKDPRREEIRRQRIDSEQKRRDELREGFGRLKEVLPRTTQKSSKIVILERTVQHIREMTAQNSHNEQRIQHLEKTVADLQHLNERISLQNVQQLINRDTMGGSMLLQ